MRRRKFIQNTLGGLAMLTAARVSGLALGAKASAPGPSPAVLHGRSNEMAYADGHSEARQWSDGSMITEMPSTPARNTDNWPASPNCGDLAWLNSVTTAQSK